MSADGPGADLHRLRQWADIHDGQELKGLQQQAGYRSARPTFSKSSFSACNARPLHTEGPQADIYPSVPKHIRVGRDAEPHCLNLDSHSEPHVSFEPIDFAVAERLKGSKYGCFCAFLHLGREIVPYMTGIDLDQR